MWVTKQASETINRGITAVAMTVAIATIYAGMVSEGQVGYGDEFPQIQTAFTLPELDVKQAPVAETVQQAQTAQESLATLVIGSQSSRYNYQ